MSADLARTRKQGPRLAPREPVVLDAVNIDLTPPRTLDLGHDAARLRGLSHVAQGRFNRRLNVDDCSALGRPPLGGLFVGISGKTKIRSDRYRSRSIASVLPFA